MVQGQGLVRVYGVGVFILVPCRFVYENGKLVYVIIVPCDVRELDCVVHVRIVCLGICLSVIVIVYGILEVGELVIVLRDLGVVHHAQLVRLGVFNAQVADHQIVECGHVIEVCREDHLVVNYCRVVPSGYGINVKNLHGDVVAGRLKLCRHAVVLVPSAGVVNTPDGYAVGACRGIVQEIALGEQKRCCGFLVYVVVQGIGVGCVLPLELALYSVCGGLGISVLILFVIGCSLGLSYQGLVNYYLVLLCFFVIYPLCVIKIVHGYAAGALCVKDAGEFAVAVKQVLVAGCACSVRHNLLGGVMLVQRNPVGRYGRGVFGDVFGLFGVEEVVAYVGRVARVEQVSVGVSAHGERVAHAVGTAVIKAFACALCIRIAVVEGRVAVGVAYGGVCVNVQDAYAVIDKLAEVYVTVVIVVVVVIIVIFNVFLRCPADDLFAEDVFGGMVLVQDDALSLNAFRGLNVLGVSRYGVELVVAEVGAG